MHTRRNLLLLASLLAGGCASGPPPIDQMQPEAISMAERRGQFEMNCPTAKGQLISRESIQPVVQFSYRFQGTVRDEYTVGVAGCGKRMTYVVICPENGNSCFAGAGRNEG